MMQEEAYKDRLLPAITRLGFDEWEDFFGTRKDDILIHRLDVDTMSPYIPRGSVLLVDTRAKWPISGEMYLMRPGPNWAPMVKQVYWGQYKGDRRVLECRDSYQLFRRLHKTTKQYTWKISQEELEARKLDWFVGRVIGAVVMFHKL